MTDHRFILRTIHQYQPVMRSDLWRICSLNIQRDSFTYVLSTLVKKGLIHSAGKNGPVWLTIRGQEQRGWSPTEGAEPAERGEW